MLQSSEEPTPVPQSKCMGDIEELAASYERKLIEVSAVSILMEGSAGCSQSVTTVLPIATLTTSVQIVSELILALLKPQLVIFISHFHCFGQVRLAVPPLPLGGDVDISASFLELSLQLLLYMSMLLIAIS